MGANVFLLGTHSRQGGMLVESNPHVFPNYAWSLTRPPHHGHHFNQISPSRLGQQSAQSFPHLHQQHQTQYQPSPNQWEALSHNQYHPQGKAALTSNECIWFYMFFKDHSFHMIFIVSSHIFKQAREMDHWVSPSPPLFLERIEGWIHS